MHNSFIFILLLLAAFCHAGWSSIIKGNSNPLGIMGLTSIVELIVFFPLLFYVPLPTIEMWYYIIATTILHGFYRLNVLYSYKYGDLSYVYPIARGGSSLIIVLISIFFLSDKINFYGFIGILIVCLALFLISRNMFFKINKIAFLLAISTAILIASYTIIDGLGIRGSNNPYSYLFWILFLNGTPVIIISALKKQKGLRKFDIILLKWGILAGLLAIISYGIVVWSMQFIEIAYVSSIRETSIIFATLLSFLILNEKRAKNRIFPSILVVMGISIVYFQL